MSEGELSANMAKGWIEAWIRMDLEWLRQNLAPDFTHTSPFGRLEGRDHYLATVEPMARKSVTKLEIKAVISTGAEAAVWFENTTPQGVIPTCDWVHVREDRITSIQSFYDGGAVRAVLTEDEQRTLDG